MPRPAAHVQLCAGWEGVACRIEKVPPLGGGRVNLYATWLPWWAKPAPFKLNAAAGIVVTAKKAGRAHGRFVSARHTITARGFVKARFHDCNQNRTLGARLRKTRTCRMSRRPLVHTANSCRWQLAALFGVNVDRDLATPPHLRRPKRKQMLKNLE